MAGYTGIIPDGSTMDDYIRTTEYLASTIFAPIGFRIDTQSTDQAVQTVDQFGNSFTPPTWFFTKHPLWAGMWTYFYNRSTGLFSIGNDCKGGTKSLTGSDGDVFVKVMGANFRYRFVDNRYHEYVVSPLTVPFGGSSPHAFTMSRGGNARPFVFHSAYEASLLIDDTGNYKIQSVSGVQPMTGNTIQKLQYTSGGTAQIQIGEVITGETSAAQGTVMGVQLSSGTWAGGDAAGYLFLRNKTGTFQAENLTGSTLGSNCATAAGASVALSFTVTNAETFAQNKGAKFGVPDIHLKTYLDILQVIEAGTLDVPSMFGKGLVNLTSGSGYIGKFTGSDNIDNLGDSNGTGQGDGTDGQVAIRYRNIHNRYGNNYKHVLGLNVFTDGSYHIAKRDGTGTLTEILAAGSYEVGGGTIPTNGGSTDTSGYISATQTDQIGGPCFIPSACVGLSSQRWSDKWYGPKSANNAIFYGGGPISNNEAGPFMLSSSSAAGASNSALSTHFVYYP